jgi:hypothetical protein
VLKVRFASVHEISSVEKAEIDIEEELRLADDVVLAYSWRTAD